MRNIHKLVETYKENGFHPFPLAPMSKVPMDGTSHETLEQFGVFEESSNIGLYAGNGLVVVDADSQKTEEVISQKFKEMGVLDHLTLVHTPTRGGTHYYIKAEAVPLESPSYRLIVPSIGKGEVRLHKNAYVVAPGSVLDTGEYTIAQGGIEYYPHQPVVEWKDLIWLIPFKGDTGEIQPKVSRIPVRLLYRENPKPARFLSYFSRTYEKGSRVPRVNMDTGESNGEFPSVSEAEGHVIMGLVLCGWTFEQVLTLFDREQPAHYRETTNPDVYLWGVYNSAIIKLMDRDISHAVGRAYRNVLSMAWPGRTGEYDQKVLLAILSFAWANNTLQPEMSYRDISEHTGISKRNTIHQSLIRLQNAGLLRILRRDNYLDVSSYDVSQTVNRVTINKSDRENVINGNPIDTLTTGELWGRTFLGGSTQMVYVHLTDTPVSVATLEKATGKSKNTVKSALRELAELNLSELIPGGWVKGRADPEVVARNLGAYDRAKERRKEHKRQRDTFSEIKRRQ